MELRVAGETVYAYTGGKTFDPKLPAVVLVHGGEQDHSVWALQSRYLAHHGYAVLAVDLPGHGKSSGAPLASIDDMAGWIVALLDAARSAPRPWSATAWGRSPRSNALHGILSASAASPCLEPPSRCACRPICSRRRDTANPRPTA